MTPFALFLIGFLEIILFFVVRLMPVWPSRRHTCDAYYFLMTAEEFRKNRKIPIVLPPYYMADIEEQWYPPGFSIFLGLLPPALLTRYHWMINHVLDFLNMVLMDGWLWWMTGRVETVLIANAVYILTPALTLEYASLTSRSLGNLLFTLLMICLYPLAVGANSVFGGWLVSALLAAAIWFLILMTHKMTMQLGLFAAAVLAVAFRSWAPVAIAFGVVLLSILVTRGYYWKLLKAHWDIVSFWNKHQLRLTAHQVYDSEIYRDTAKGFLGRNGKFMQPLRFLLRVLGYNPFIYVAIVVLFTPVGSSGMPRYFGLWVGAVLAWAIATTLVPYLKALGEGYKYIKYSALPAAAFIGLTAGDWSDIRLSVLAVFMAIASAAVLVKVIVCRWRSYRNASLAGGNEESEIIRYVQENKHIDRIGCISNYISDALVYFARRHVLWGTHHYCFNSKVIDIHPVLSLPIEQISEKYDLKYWLINTAYVDPSVLGFSNKVLEKEAGIYRLYRVEEAV